LRASFKYTENYKNPLNLEDVMKKVFSVLAMVMVMVSLAGCMDDPDQGNPKPKGYGSTNQQGSGVK